MSGRLIANVFIVLMIGVIAGLVLLLGARYANNESSDTAVAAESETVKLVAMNSGLCLAINTGAVRNGADVAQHQCGDYPDQDLQVLDAGNGWNYLKFAHSGKCLTVRAESRDDGANLEQWDCLGLANQKWNGSFVANTSGAHSSQLNPSKCITVEGESRAIGALIEQWQCLGQSNQTWKTVSSTDSTLSSPTPAPTERPEETPTTLPAPGAATNRQDCDAIRGTAYSSDEERAWFLGNCLATSNRANCDAIRGSEYLSSAERTWYLSHCT